VFFQPRPPPAAVSNLQCVEFSRHRRSCSLQPVWDTKRQISHALIVPGQS
jgi:hypothetical protein